ncbi:MAG: hypothetical protein DMG27_12040, partial [Acidobacteria bacterium]
TADQLGEAIIHIQKALALSPDQPDLHLRLGEVFLRAGNWRRAAEEFEAELRLRPHNLAARVRRGETRLIEGDVDGALADWAQAASTDEVQAEVILGVRDLGFGAAGFEQLPDPVRRGIKFLRPRFADENKLGARLIPSRSHGTAAEPENPALGLLLGRCDPSLVGSGPVLEAARMPARVTRRCGLGQNSLPPRPRSV